MHIDVYSMPGPYLLCLSRLRLVFQWLMTAFASHLDCRELLLLWDRVVGFDSMDVIAGQTFPL